MVTIAESALAHSDVNHADEPDLAFNITLQDVRMAMESCGVIYPEMPLGEQEYFGQEDTRGVDDFISWAQGPRNREIRRIALEGGDGAKDDYLTGEFGCLARSFHTLIKYSSQEETQHNR